MTTLHNDGQDREMRLSTGLPLRRDPEVIVSDCLARVLATTKEAYASAERAARGMAEDSDEVIVRNALDDLVHDLSGAEDELLHSLKQLSTYRPEAA